MCWFILWGVFLTGCGEPEAPKALEFIIKTPSRTITQYEFLEELDLKKAAYPYNINEDPAEYNEMVMHLVEMLSEEIVLLSAAADKGIVVSKAEVQSAEAEFKKDYPEDSFEQILLKNAITYSFWKERFKKNMIMDKLIDQELKQKIEITSEDLVEFYNNHITKNNLNTDDKDHALEKNESETEKELVSRLRMQKTQENYEEWIQLLWKDYPVEINKEKLKTFLIDIEQSEGSKNENKD